MASRFNRSGNRSGKHGPLMTKKTNKKTRRVLDPNQIYKLKLIQQVFNFSK